MSSTPYSPLDGISHPYYPPDATVPFYTANTTPLLTILLSFAGLISLFVLICLTLSRYANPKLQQSDLAVIAWFAVCMYHHHPAFPLPTQLTSTQAASSTSFSKVTSSSTTKPYPAPSTSSHSSGKNTA